MRVSRAAIGAVTTIEGLSEDGSHPLQRERVAEAVPQCGYSQAGHIMTAAALLETNASRSDEEIIAAIAAAECSSRSGCPAARGAVRARRTVASDAGHGWR